MREATIGKIRKGMMCGFLLWCVTLGSICFIPPIFSKDSAILIMVIVGIFPFAFMFGMGVKEYFKIPVGS